MDEYEELNRWIQRAQIQRRQLRSGSKQERRLSRAIRGMEIHQLGRRIQRTRTELSRLPAGSDESRKLAQALEQWDNEHVAGLQEMRAAALEGRSPALVGAGEPTAEARAALDRASGYLLHPAPDAGLREAIAEIEQALARLKELRGR